MEKDFDGWNKQKREIEYGVRPPFFKEREIWWTCLGLNIGFEQDGKNVGFKRPVLILKKFNQYIVLGVPLTTLKKEDRYHVECVCNEDDVFRMAIISQIRLLDAKRFADKIGMVNDKSFLAVKTAIGSMFQ